VLTGGNSIQLVRVFGIRIGVDVSWFIVLFLIIWLLSDYYGELFPDQEGRAFLLAVVSALLFFLSVVLHELGHAWVAIRNGIGITGIDLWMFGGVAKMSSDTQSPGAEFRVAIAGPAVTLLIVIACFGLGALLAGSGVDESATFQVTRDLSPAEAVVGYLGSINLILLLFNLIPGFPLDGGRILRAIAWWRTGNRNRATVLAAQVGRAFAVVIMVGGGLWALSRGDVIGAVWFVFIGFFLMQAARSAQTQTAVTARLEGVRVGDVMDAEPVAIPSLTRLDAALDEYFLRYRFPWFPVVDAGGRLVGVVTRDAVEDVPDSLRPQWTVDEVTSKQGTDSLRIGVEEPLETVLGSDGLTRLGALMAVDGEGHLRGVLTLDQVRRALATPEPAV
jgi:Zn-dependent protease